VGSYLILFISSHSFMTNQKLTRAYKYRAFVRSAEADLADLVALLNTEGARMINYASCTDHKWLLDLGIAMARAAALLQQQPQPVAWCHSKEFSEAMRRGGSFNGWKDPTEGPNQCDLRLYAHPPAATHQR
jgi:hypothetical protein